MTRLAAIFLSTLLLPQLAFAKRLAPVKLEPVVYQGIRYIAPNDDGRRGYIDAWNVGTNNKLWELTLFTNRIDPNLEEDVQWVFINALNVRYGSLIATAEDKQTYQVDLKTKEITPSVSPSPKSLGPTSDVPDADKKSPNERVARKKV